MAAITPVVFADDLQLVLYSLSTTARANRAAPSGCEFLLRLPEPDFL